MSEEKTETKALAVARGSGMVLTTFEDHKKFAMAAFHAGILGGDHSAEAVGKAMISMQYGAELGVGPMSSIAGINVIKGKPAMGAALIGSLIQKSDRYRARVGRRINGKVCAFGTEGSEADHDTKRCRIVFFERFDGQVWEEVGDSVFTIDDARRSELLGRPGKMWEKYPRNLLYARALSNGARWHCQAIFCGAVYTPEELGSGTIDASFEVVAEPSRYCEPVNPAEPAKFTPEALDAAAKFTPERDWIAEREALDAKFTPEALDAESFREYDGGPSAKQFERLVEYTKHTAVPDKWKVKLEKYMHAAKNGAIQKGAIGRALGAVKKLLAEIDPDLGEPEPPDEPEGEVAGILARAEANKPDEEHPDWSKLPLLHTELKKAAPDSEEFGMLERLWKDHDGGHVSEDRRLEVFAKVQAVLDRASGTPAVDLDAKTKALVDELRELRKDKRCDGGLISAIEKAIGLADRGMATIPELQSLANDAAAFFANAAFFDDLDERIF